MYHAVLCNEKKSLVKILPSLLLIKSYLRKMNSCIKNIYDEIYSEIENYNYFDNLKNSIVDLFGQVFRGQVLDAGCGQGIHLKRLLSCKVNAFGIELSEVCCDRYLKGFPHQNSDIVSFSKNNRQFEAIICMDVLEHIPLPSLKENLIALSRMLKDEGAILFFIANHSDIINGKELHLIQEDEHWWKEKLEQFFPYVKFLTSQFQGRGFYFFCCKKVTDQCRIFLSLANTFTGNVETFERLTSNQTLSEETIKKLRIKNDKLQTLLVEIERQLSVVEGDFRECSTKVDNLTTEIEKKDLEFSEFKKYSVQAMSRKKLLYYIAKKTIQKNPYLYKFISRRFVRRVQAFLLK